jgi:hypothetical protein
MGRCGQAGSQRRSTSPDRWWGMCAPAGRLRSSAGFTEKAASATISCCGGGTQGEGTAAMGMRLYFARLRWSKRVPFVVQRWLVRSVVLVVGVAAILVVVGIVSLHSLTELI